MIKGRRATRVLISSTAGQARRSFHCDYAASKGAADQHGEGALDGLAPDHIHVNLAVAPGWVARICPAGLR